MSNSIDLHKGVFDVISVSIIVSWLKIYKIVFRWKLFFECIAGEGWESHSLFHNNTTTHGWVVTLVIPPLYTIIGEIGLVTTTIQASNYLNNWAFHTE